MRIIFTFEEVAAATSETAAYAAVLSALGLAAAAARMAKPSLQVFEELASSAPAMVRIDHNQSVVVISLPAAMVVETSKKVAAFLETNLGLFAALGGLLKALGTGAKGLVSDIKGIWL